MTMDKDITITNYEIDKITYIVESQPSETAKETLHTKIDKLLLRDLRYYNDNENNT